MKRGSFNSKLGFILAASGSAVGLGNIWKFPFEVSNGGGAAFLLMYLIFCFILSALKRYTNYNPINLKKCRRKIADHFIKKGNYKLFNLL